MLKFYISTLVTILFFGLTKVSSQVNYSFSAIAGAYTAISGGTTATLTQADPAGGFAATDEGYQNNISIGFPFNYNGTIYNTIHINTNGFASFTPIATIQDTDAEAYYIDDLSSGPYVQPDIRPILAPLWEDHDFSNASNIKFATTGSSPNRVFTVEWGNALWDYSATSPVISFQLKLFEGTNVVEFVYRREAEPRAAEEDSDGASIGITSTAYGSGSYLSLNNSGSSPTASSAVNTQTITEKPATGQIYRFTPTFSFPVTLSYFKGVRNGNRNELSWTTQTEQNNRGFELQRSVDGNNFSKITFVPSKAVGGNSSSNLQYSFADTKPFNGDNYYRLKQVDKDERITYSSVVFLKGLKPTSLQLSRVYPNPVLSTLKLVVAASSNGKIDIVITDVTGKVVMKYVAGVVAGDNTLTVNVEQLPPGSYVIKANDPRGSESAVSKFVK